LTLPLPSDKKFRMLEGERAASADNRPATD